MKKYAKRENMRKWLNSYRFICKEIEAREKHLQEFIEDIYNPLQAVQISDMPKGNGTSDQTYKTVERIEKQYSQMLLDMENRIEDLTKAKNEIEKAIDSLDEYERCVCYHRFILGIYWADLPAYIGYEQAQCTRYETKALDKLAKMINNDKL